MWKKNSTKFTSYFVNILYVSLLGIRARFPPLTRHSACASSNVLNASFITQKHWSSKTSDLLVWFGQLSVLKQKINSNKFQINLLMPEKKLTQASKVRLLSKSFWKEKKSNFLIGMHKNISRHTDLVVYITLIYNYMHSYLVYIMQVFIIKISLFWRKYQLSMRRNQISKHNKYNIFVLIDLDDSKYLYLPNT